jgi:hypothetical protein
VLPLPLPVVSLHLPGLYLLSVALAAVWRPALQQSLSGLSLAISQTWALSAFMCSSMV